MSVSHDDPDFSVTGSSRRGYPSLDEFQKEKLKQEQNDDSQEPEEYSVSRGELKSGTSKTYSGTLYKNTFFGPSENIITDTKPVCVTIGVNASLCFYTHKKKYRNMLKTDFLKVMKTPEKGKKFRVDFPKPIYLRANTWYDIEFELQGCPVGQMDESKKTTDFMVKNSADGTVAKFNFLLGSCQMPDIHFRFP